MDQPEFIAGDYGKCYFCDCLDPDYGVASFGNDEFDVSFADPPYNVGFEKKEFGGVAVSKRRDSSGVVSSYADSVDTAEYMAWNMRWVESVLKCAKGLVVTCGLQNLYDWICARRPDYLLKGWYKPNAENFQDFDPILLYGRVKGVNHIPNYILKFNISPYRAALAHPCPKSHDLLRYIILKLGVASIIDPFLGSGTVAEIAEEMGVRWVGYEVNQKYRADIALRIRNGAVSHRFFDKKTACHKGKPTYRRFF